MNFPKIFALKGVTKASEQQLTDAKAELIGQGIIGYGLFPEDEIANAVKQKTENERLTAELKTATDANALAITNAKTSKDALDAANATILANATKITGLEEKVEAFGKNAGGKHEEVEGKDIEAEKGEKDLEALLAAMPHNKAADALGA